MADVQLQRVGDSLSGRIGDEHVDLVLDVPNSRAGIRGTCGNVPLHGYWRVESNHDNPRPVGLFLGEYGDAPVFLRNEVHLTPHYSLRRAELSGTIGELALHAVISPVEAAAYGPTVLSIDGDADGRTISVYVSVAENGSAIALDGLVGGSRVALVAGRRSVTGDYAGPAELFALFACTPLYFL